MTMLHEGAFSCPSLSHTVSLQAAHIPSGTLYHTSAISIVNLDLYLKEIMFSLKESVRNLVSQACIQGNFIKTVYFVL